MILKTVFTLLLFGFPNSSFSARKNVLFIGSDDMRPNINIYSDATDYAKPTMHTPNLDKVTNNENVDFGFWFFFRHNSRTFISARRTEHCVRVCLCATSSLQPQ